METKDHCKIKGCFEQSKALGFCKKHYDKHYAATHKDKVKEWAKNYRMRHPEKFREMAKRYYEKHKYDPTFIEKNRANTKKWQKMNRPKLREYERAHRKRLLERQNNMTDEEFLQQCRAAGLFEGLHNEAYGVAADVWNNDQDNWWEEKIPRKYGSFDFGPVKVKPEEIVSAKDLIPTNNLSKGSFLSLERKMSRKGKFNRIFSNALHRRKEQQKKDSKFKHYIREKYPDIYWEAVYEAGDGYMMSEFHKKCHEYRRKCLV